MTTPRNTKGTGRNKMIGYQPPSDVVAILATLPKGKRSEAINQAIRSTYGEGEQAAKAKLQALLLQVES